MKKIFLISISLVLLLISNGCSNNDDDTNIITPEILEFSNPPFVLTNTSTKFAANIAYDEHTKNVFDIFLPTSATTTPLLIYIHGGGFSSGDKTEVYSPQNLDGQSTITQINSLLEDGIAFASINYRLLGLNDAEGVIKSLKDSRRCLQYIRSRAADFNIDKSKIVLVGTSAGAGTSLWIGLQNDIADVNAEDPVLRESTKVKGIAAIETQATYDLKKWETDVFQEYDFNLETTISTNPAFTFIFNSFYGISSFSEFESDATIAYRKEVDILDLMDKNDPELWISNVLTPEEAPSNLNIMYHHPYHARTLKQKADIEGLQNTTSYSTTAAASGEPLFDFIKRKLNE